MASVPDTVTALRSSFAAGKTRSVEWRKAQLKAFLKMVKAGTPALLGGLAKDLHKSAYEGMAMELGGIMHEAKMMMDKLDEWMAPQEVPCPPPNAPGSSFIYKDPLGVVLIIGAWNYPVYLTLMPMIGAIAGGNCVCIKMPSDKYSAASSRAMADLIGKYLDPECVKVVEGDRRATQAVLQERWDLIFFTGGSFVGQMVAEAAAKHLTPTILELGGKSPAIVDRTANLEVAARRAVWGTFTNAGQTCIRPDYLMVHADVADEFVGLMKAETRRQFGDKPQESSSFGRLINERAWDRVSGLVEADRPYVVLGGEADRADRFVGPTILDFGTDFEAFKASKVMSDEIFGPLFPVYRYRDLAEAIAFIQGQEKPLAMYVFTEDQAVSEQVLAETTAGGVNVNDTMMHLSNPFLPFGGVGKSGMGSYHGKFSFDSFTHSKAVLKKTTDSDSKKRYAPYPKL